MLRLCEIGQVVTAICKLVRRYMSLELSAAAGLALGLVGLLMGYSVGSFA